MRSNAVTVGILFTGILCVFLPGAGSSQQVGELPRKDGAAVVSVSAREPVSAKDVSEVADLFNAYAATVDAKDLVAHFKLYHFPVVRFVGGTVTTWADAAAVPTDLFQVGVVPDAVKSAWGPVDIVQSGIDKLHVTATFHRLRKDGSTIIQYSSLFILERVNGRWGFRARSALQRQ